MLRSSLISSSGSPAPSLQASIDSRDKLSLRFIHPLGFSRASVMEGSHSEAIFDSLNLNPQLFINEVINTVEGLTDEAIESYEQEASTVLGVMGVEKSEKLKESVSIMHRVLQGGMDKHLGAWEKFCLQHIFNVPDGFMLPEADSSSSKLSLLDGLTNDELDFQLDFLRGKLAVVGRESAEMRRNLDTLESHSILSYDNSKSVIEAVEPFEQKPIHNIYQEILSNVPELRMKVMAALKKKNKNMEQIIVKRIDNPDRSLSLEDIKGLTMKIFRHS